MAPKRKKQNGAKGAVAAKKPAATGAQTDPAVIAMLRDMRHPMKKEIEAIRQIILGVSPEIHEGAKWSSPSFRTTEWFATLNLRGKVVDLRVWLILHTGAKAKNKELTIDDPKGLLKWLGKNRALITFDDGKDVAAKRTALIAIIRQWIRQV